MKKITLLIVSILAVFSVAGQEIPTRPNPPRLVNDYTSILSRNEEAALENEFEDFARKTSTQIVVVVVKSFDGTDISDFAFKLGEKWGIGQDGKDNGALIVVKPKSLNERGEVFIATGYGLEHLIPDAVANQIVNNEMIPRFKQNNYYEGLVAGAKVIMDLTREEYTAEEYNEYVASQSHGKPFPFVIFILLFVIIPLLRGRRRGGHFSSRRSNLPFWIALGMMGSHRNSHNGSFGNFSSGSGGFGGFGGFGGGSFGGGGAGGSW